jgi:hypothetical protein
MLVFIVDIVASDGNILKSTWYYNYKDAQVGYQGLGKDPLLQTNPGANVLPPRTEIRDPNPQPELDRRRKAEAQMDRVRRVADCLIPESGVKSGVFSFEGSQVR